MKISLVHTLVCLLTGLLVIMKCQNISSRSISSSCHPDNFYQIFVLSVHIQRSRSFCFFRRPKVRGGIVLLYPIVSKHSKLLVITLLLLLAGDVETNPGPDSTLSSSFPCGLCEVDANWSNGGIACENCDRWYHKRCALSHCPFTLGANNNNNNKRCADLSLSSFNRLANTSLVWICKQCN